MDISNQIMNSQSALLAQQSAASKAGLEKASQQQNDPRAWEAAQKFESMFLSQMMNLMFKDVPTDGYFGGGSSEEIFRSMLVNEYGDGIVKNGGLGLADSIYRNILELQEAVDAANG